MIVQSMTEAHLCVMQLLNLNGREYLWHTRASTGVLNDSPTPPLPADSKVSDSDLQEVLEYLYLGAEDR